MYKRTSNTITYSYSNSLLKNSQSKRIKLEDILCNEWITGRGRFALFLLGILCMECPSIPKLINAFTRSCILSFGISKMIFAISINSYNNVQKKTEIIN